MTLARTAVRVVADLCDGIILIAVKLALAGAFVPIHHLAGKLDRIGPTLQWALWIFYFITISFLFFMYYTYFYSRHGASPGKWLFGVRVVDAESHNVITRRQACLRALGYLLGGLPLYLGIIWILFDRNKRGWHDHLAGTIVVDANPKEEP